jgi:ligand-binding sensor domain-containing protein
MRRPRFFGQIKAKQAFFRRYLRYSRAVACQFRHTRVFGLALAALALAAVLGAGWALFRAARAVENSEKSLAAAEGIVFVSAPLDRQASSGFEAIAAPAVFRDAAVFQGKLYVCGPAGLLEYDAEGGVRARYRAGLELPGPLVSLAVGLAGASEPELFIATAGEGLLAFNGRAFRQVRPEAAPYRGLTAILALPTGRLLLGTQKKGVLVYDGKRIREFHPALKDVAVTALAGDDSSVWVGTVDRGVLHWHGGEVDAMGESEGLPDARVLSLAVAGRAAYAGTPLGVAEFIEGRFQRVLASGFFAQSLLVRDDALAVGTLGEGVAEVPLAGARPRPALQAGEPLPGKIERLLEIEGGLYAVSESGLYRVDERRGGWRRVLEREAAPLADRNVSALGFDAAGRLWIGYFDRGLDILDPGGDRARHIEDDHVFCVNRIVGDSERGIMAVATANGLVLFDEAGRRKQVLTRTDGLIASHVTDVLAGAGGMTLATPAGLTFMDTTGMRSLYAFHGLVNNHVYALARSGGRVLAGTLGGLSVLDGDTIRANYTTANSGLRHNWITAIVPVGVDWFVGTYGAGVMRFTASGRWETFPDLRAPFEVNSNAMLVTARSVYAGSLAGGLYVYHRATGRWSDITAGLPSANVTALAARGDSIYVGTDNGLVRFKETL